MTECLKAMKRSKLIGEKDIKVNLIFNEKKFNNFLNFQIIL